MLKLFWLIRKFLRIILILISNIVNRTKFFFCGAKLGKRVKFRGVLNIQAEKKNSIILSNNIIINSGKNQNAVGFGTRTSLFAIKNGKIRIGNNVGLSNAAIVSMNEICIEDNVLIGNGVKIYDTDFHSLNYQDRIKEDNDIKTAPVMIKEGAFIGAGTTILKNVTIGKHSIVGAASVVTKSIPDNQIWAGNPAKFIRECE